MNKENQLDSDYINIENLEKAVNAVEETLKDNGAIKEAEVQLVLHSVLTNARQRNSERRLESIYDIEREGSDQDGR